MKYGIIILIALSLNYSSAQNSIIVSAGHEWANYSNQMPGEWHHSTGLFVSYDHKISNKVGIRLGSIYSIHKYRNTKGLSFDIDVNNLIIDDDNISQEFSSEISSYRTPIMFSEFVTYHSTVSIDELAVKENIEYSIILNEKFSTLGVSIAPVYTPFSFKNNRLNIGIDLGVSFISTMSNIEFTRFITNQTIITLDRNIPLESLNDIEISGNSNLDTSSSIRGQLFVEYIQHISERVSLLFSAYTGYRRDNRKSGSLSSIRTGIVIQL